MLFNKNELVNRARSLEKFAVANERWTTDSLESLHESISTTKRFDVFLSHRYADREAVKGLADMLEKNFKLSVYLDWVADPVLDRNNVNKTTAKELRNRLNHCKCLWYVTSQNAEASKWMPWETGYADGHIGKVAICPLVEGRQFEFNGREYLSLYPYVDIVKANGSYPYLLRINESLTKYCSFDSWLNNNAKPTEHK